MIYKRYELSLSLTGNKIVHIARNAAGNVVFREASENKLKKAIDRSIEERQRLEELEAKKKATKANAKTKKRGLFAPPPEPEEVTDEETVTEETGSVLIPPQQRVVRGPDGKFIKTSSLQAPLISKSTLEKEEPKKKSLWQKMVS